MSVFDETFKEVKAQKSGATAGEDTVGQAPPAETTTSPETQDPVVEPVAAGEGAREVEGGEAQTTDEEINLTGLESPDDLERQHGTDWSGKTARRVLPLVKQAGGMQNLRLSAELIADIRNPEVTGDKLLDKIKGVSESRAGEIRRDIFWNTLDLPGQFDLVLQDKLQSEFPDHPLTLDFIKQAVQNEIQFSTGQPVEQSTDDLSDLPAAVQEKLKAYDDLMKKFPEMEKRVTGFEEQQRTTAEQRAQEEVQQWGSELYQSVFSVVEERKKELGLEIQPTDSDEVKAIKEDLQDLLAEEKLVQAFEGDAENLRQSQLAVSYLGKRDKNTAFSFAPTLQMGALKTLESALRSPRIARKFQQLKSVMESQSTPKQSARPELVQGTQAVFSVPDPYDEGVKQGLSPFDVAEQRAAQGRAVAR